MPGSARLAADGEAPQLAGAYDDVCETGMAHDTDGCGGPKEPEEPAVAVPDHLSFMEGGEHP